MTLAESRLKSGLGLPCDVVRAQTALAEAIQILTTARGATEVSRVTRALNIGIDPERRSSQ